jgi:nitrogen-specific signal transduction histidine kinase/ActR/RegA family two-component response regulator
MKEAHDEQGRDRTGSGSSELVRSLFALLPVPVAVVEHDGRILLSNSAFSDLFQDIESIHALPRHELELSGHGTYELETVPLNDQGMKIVYAVEITNEVQLRRQVAHMEKVIQSLLSLTAKTEPSHEAFDLNDSVRNVVQLRDGESVDISIRTDLAKDLPCAFGDSHQMEQVILNLIGNAEDAIADAQRKPGSIEVRTFVEGGRIHMTVVDNGSGIHARHMARIFDPFFTTKEKHRGSGLGLSICAEIVKDHGGQLYAWSRYGAGSTFTLELPVRRDVEPKQIRPVCTSQGQVLRGKQILAIDDDVQITELIFDVLARQGARIDIVNSGVQAIEKIKQKNYDAIICDQRMPGFSGQRLYRLVESLNPELRQRFLFVTGDVVSAQTKRFFSNAGVQYIRKPFRAQELLDAVEGLLSRSQLPGS